MTNTEIIQAIKSEIEKRLKNTRDYMNGAGMKYKGPKYHASRGRESAYDAILSFLSTLESEKPVPADLEEASEKYSKERAEGHILYDWVHAFIAGAKWQKEQDEKEQADLFTIVALDAAQRAKEQLMKEGLDAVKSGQSNKIEKTIAGVFVKYGMDRQREMMMKEAVEGVIDDCGTPTRLSLKTHCDSFRIGDKVRIIVLPQKD